MAPQPAGGRGVLMTYPYTVEAGVTSLRFLWEVNNDGATGLSEAFRLGRFFVRSIADAKSYDSSLVA